VFVIIGADEESLSKKNRSNILNHLESSIVDQMAEREKETVINEQFTVVVEGQERPSMLKRAKMDEQIKVNPSIIDSYPSIY
jgi:uncharacterized membrane-anchored protein